jgi:molecular chaperone HtpG
VKTKERQFQIYLPGLLEVLAENLYSNEKVAIRELIQNAHDSCLRRSVENNDPTFKPRIDVSVDAKHRTLTIQDNGSGLTEDEIQNYLSTIGRSYTRELEENLAIFSPEKAQKLIGQFGLGFLSAFLIASEVILTTRSSQDRSETLRWHSTGDANYSVTITEKRPIGTVITLKLKTIAASLMNQTLLENTIRQYADFLSVPIYLEGKTKCINSMNPPWEMSGPSSSIREYITQRFNVQNPLCIIQLKDHIINVGHDTIKIPLEGFLFVPPGTIASIHEYGDLTIYIRRMFISDGPSDLLPSWARFVRGVIDCSLLQPTTSREQVQHNYGFDLVKQAVKEQLTSGLQRIAYEEPSAWRQIVHGHHDVIIGWAVKDTAFFQEIADIVTFRTSRGVLTLPEYLNLSGGIIYYTSREIGSLQEQLLSEGLSKPVIDASIFAEVAFLTRYAKQHPAINIVQIDDGLNKLFRPVEAREPFVSLLDYFKEKGIQAQVVTFDPNVVPAIIIYPDKAELMEEARDALDAGYLPDPFAEVIDSYVSNLEGDNTMGGTLYLNSANSLIQWAASASDIKTRDTILMLIYQMARLFNGRLLNIEKVTQLFRAATETLMKLVTEQYSK